MDVALPFLKVYCRIPILGGCSAPATAWSSIPRAASGEKSLTAYLDLDLVIMIRGHDTAGLNAILEAAARCAPPFPPAQHGSATGEVLRTLGPSLPMATAPSAPFQTPMCV